MSGRKAGRWLLLGWVTVALVGGCGRSGATAGPTSGISSPPIAASSASPARAGPSGDGGAIAVSPQFPVPPESNPPGDIPDTQVFVPYTSNPGGFTIRVPQGWTRRLRGPSVSFTDKLNSITASWGPAATRPTPTSAKTTDVPALRRTQPAFRLKSISTANLSGGSAVLITYEANSRPNPVTGKRYRLVVERFELYRGGTEAVLELSSPVGADNVDPWRIVSGSFRWR